MVEEGHNWVLLNKARWLTSLNQDTKAAAGGGGSLHLDFVRIGGFGWPTKILLVS